MNEYPSSFDSMLAAWNELDLEKVRHHLDQALSPDVSFIDPSIVTQGIAEFEQNVRHFRTKYPDVRCIRTSGVDSHHNLYRYNWEIRRGDALLITGFDVVEVDAQGRVAKVMGFFGPLPPKTN